MDVDEVQGISVSPPMQLGEGQWFCEMIVRTANGTLAVQMLAQDPSVFAFEIPEAQISQFPARTITPCASDARDRRCFS